MKPIPSTSPGVNRVVLTGFMGSGKTTVGRILAERLHWRFADLDDAVEARERRTVPQIFAESGEASFRALEAEALSHLLLGEKLVIALGGGAPTTLAIRDLLQKAQGTAIVHLQAPFSVLYDRCTVQATDPGATERPLLRDIDAARHRYEQRQAVYAALAQHRADAALTPDRVAEEILQKLGFRGHSAL